MVCHSTYYKTVDLSTTQKTLNVISYSSLLFSSPRVLLTGIVGRRGRRRGLHRCYRALNRLIEWVCSQQAGIIIVIFSIEAKAPRDVHRPPIPGLQLAEVVEGLNRNPEQAFCRI